MVKFNINFYFEQELVIRGVGMLQYAIYIFFLLRGIDEKINYSIYLNNYNLWFATKFYWRSPTA